MFKLTSLWFPTKDMFSFKSSFEPFCVEYSGIRRSGEGQENRGFVFASRKQRFTCVHCQHMRNAQKKIQKERKQKLLVFISDFTFRKNVLGLFLVNDFFLFTTWY